MKQKISAIIIVAVILTATFLLFVFLTKREPVRLAVFPSVSVSITPLASAKPTLAPTATPISIAASTPIKDISDADILFDVPFTSQAPFGGWSDTRQQDGCEEAAILMAVRWARGQTLTSQEALEEIIGASEYQLTSYGSYYDTSAQDTADRIAREYFKYADVEVRHDIGSKDIQAELTKGYVVIIPANGRKLFNPNFTPPGPLHHMLVIRGYDSKTDEFITNDPGTRRGEAYRYPSDIIQGALFDYSTGHDEPISDIIRTAMIIVRPITEPY